MIDTMKLPINGMPDSPQQVIESLFPFFPDLDFFSCNRNNDFWEITYSRHAFDYCDQVGHAAAKWGIPLELIPDFYWHDDRCFFTLLDSWSAYAWSLYTVQHHLCSSTELALLHIDDHTDMLSPKFRIADDGSWLSPFSGKKLSFFRPHDIREAVRSGIIGVGNIVAIPALVFLKSRIFHLKRKEDFFSSRLDWCYENSAIPGLNILSHAWQHQSSGIHNFFSASSLDILCHKIKSSEIIFLHIDMDYFNNRYDGNSNWRNEWHGNDDDMALQAHNMKCLADTLKKYNLVEQIAHVSIGVSPGFYPAEFWQAGVNALLDELVSIGCPVDGLMEYLQNVK